MTKIYLQVEQSLNNYINSQSIIEKIYESLSLYKSIFDDEIKSELIQKINKIIKDYSKELIKQYLKNSYDSKSKNFDEKRIKDLTNLGGLSDALGSTRLYYETTLENTTLNYEYNFVTDPDNYKVYLNLSAKASADAKITYESEDINTILSGTLGQGMIGLNLEMDFFNEIVNAIYKTEFNNTTVKKKIEEKTTMNSWKECHDAIECFYKCPNIVDKQTKKEIPDSTDLDYYKNSSLYILITNNENRTCTYANYMCTITDEFYSFNSSLKRTV